MFLKKASVFSLGKTQTSYTSDSQSGIDREHFWSGSLESRSSQGGKFSLGVLCMENLESLVHIRGVTFRAQLMGTVPPGKGFSGPQQGMQEGAGIHLRQE